MLSRRSTEINHVSFTNVGEDVFYGGEQDVFISVEMGLYPFPLHNSPKSFSDVEVWGIGREIEYVETPVLPSLKAVLYLAALVYGGVVENHNGLFRDSEGEVFHEFDKLVGVYVFGGREAVVSIVAVYHSEDVEPAALVNRHTEILIFEFPCIRHISFGAYMTFISVIQINESRFPLTFKLLQEFLLISVLLRRGCPFGRFSYTSKSCAIKDKKFLKAPSLICFPVASSQAALALETLWRCFRMASLTASLSFLVLIMRFRPFPGLFLSPAIPSDWNLLTQCITRWYVCPARAPAAALLSPSALPNTIRHRIRNEWVEPFRYPFSRAVRCSSLIFIFVACLDIIGEISICKTITFENGFHCINSLIKHTYQFVFSYYQSGFSEEDIVLYELVDGYVVSAGESGDKDASPICARESVRMLYDSRKFYYGDIGWLGLHYYKGNGRYEVSAGPNDTGSDRYISFVYDYFGCNTGYGAVEIRQPARKTDNI